MTKEIENYYKEQTKKKLEEKIPNFINSTMDLYHEGVNAGYDIAIYIACEWLEKQLDGFHNGDIQVRFSNKTEFLESFKKEMKE